MQLCCYSRINIQEVFASGENFLDRREPIPGGSLKTIQGF